MNIFTHFLILFRQQMNILHLFSSPTPSQKQSEFTPSTTKDISNVPSQPTVVSDPHLTSDYSSHPISPTRESPQLPSYPSSSPISPIRQSPAQVSESHLRRSKRPHTKSGYLNDYICNSVYLTDLTDSCFNQPISPQHTLSLLYQLPTSRL